MSKVYPSCRYHSSGQARLIHSPEQEEEGWEQSPAAFIDKPKADAAPPQTQQEAWADAANATADADGAITIESSPVAEAKRRGRPPKAQPAE